MPLIRLAATQASYHLLDVSEQGSGSRNLRHLEANITGMLNNLNADLDQLIRVFR
jgi:hypothetical protein